MNLRVPPRLDRHLELQRWFEGVRDTAVASGGSSFCDLSWANAQDGTPAAVRDALRAAVDGPRPLDLQYTPYGGSTITRRLVARALQQTTGLPFGYRHVVLTPGAMAALNVVFRAVAEEPCGEVVVVSPCWLDYPLYLENLGLRCVFAPVLSGSLRIDLETIERALGPRTRAVILSQPANPTGLLHERRELERLSHLLASAPSKPLLIADECHRELVFDRSAFVSPAQLYDRTIVVHSFGKTLMAQGQRIGYAAVSPRMPGADDAARSLVDYCRILGFCTPTALMQLALRDLIDYRPDRTALEARRDRAYARLQGADLHVPRSDGTFFLYPEAPGGDDRAWCERLARDGVLVLPSSFFHQRGRFRISLTATDAALERGVDRICELSARARQR
jgi:aspartate aminotransferase